MQTKQRSGMIKKKLEVQILAFESYFWWPVISI